MTVSIMVPNGAADASIMEEVIAKGDLSKLSPEQRATYYVETCRSIGVNPLTKPFDYIVLNGKLTLYAAKTATDQLRTVRGVSIFKVEAETTPDGMRVVTAYARDANGREDMDLGVVNVKGLTGDALANAYMKALTKAKRRVTLSICGLGWLDESEIESVPSARPIQVDTATGEIIDAEPIAPEPLISDRQMRRMQALRNRIGMTPEQLRAMAGVASAKEMTQAQADEVIAKLEVIAAEMEPEEEPEEEPAQPSMFDADDPERFTR